MIFGFCSALGFQILDLLLIYQEICVADLHFPHDSVFNFVHLSSVIVE